MDYVENANRNSAGCLTGVDRRVSETEVVSGVFAVRPDGTCFLEYSRKNSLSKRAAAEAATTRAAAKAANLEYARRAHAARNGYTYKP